MRKYLTYLLLFAILLFGLVACGKSEATPTSTPIPLRSTATAEATARPTATTAANNNRPSPTVNRPTATTVSANTSRISPTANRTATVAVAEDELTAVKSERTIIRSFSDVQGRTIRLFYGRGNGRSGDYGWAHILGKHIEGIWYDGGTITTFPKAVGTKTPVEVVELINKSLQDKNPDEEGGGRRSYVYPVPGTNKDVFTVVGNDGTIITAYPVNHGSKDDDA